MVGYTIAKNENAVIWIKRYEQSFCVYESTEAKGNIAEVQITTENLEESLKSKSNLEQDRSDILREVILEIIEENATEIMSKYSDKVLNELG